MSLNTSSALEMLDSYFWRLQMNTGFNLFINSVCIFLVLTKSTPAMGYYKYYILFTVVTAMVMDFHVSCIYGLYIFFPQPVTCATGIARYFNYYFGSILNYVSFVILEYLLDLLILATHAFHTEWCWIIYHDRIYL